MDSDTARSKGFPAFSVGSRKLSLVRVLEIRDIEAQPTRVQTAAAGFKDGSHG